VVIERGSSDGERAGDLRHADVAAVAHRQRCGFLFGGELHRAAVESAGGFGDFPAGLAAFADQLALELCKGGEQV
jgi:hypothetical protein